MTAVKKTRKKKSETVQPAEVITAYKAFDENFKCRGFQYEIGKEYVHDGDVEPCSSGFHACKDPLDVLSYYPILGSRFAEVEVYGTVKEHEEDSKVASSHIKIKAEITVGVFIKASVDAVFNGWFKKTMEEKTSENVQASSGDNAQQASSGYNAQQASSGYNAQQASSGNYAQQASSGYNAKQASSGNYAQQASSGYNAKQASSGYNAQQASSGNYAKQASSGNYAKQASSGYNAKQEITGDFGVLSSVHARGKFKGKAGTLVSLVFFEKDEITPIKFVTGKVGENGLKADTWYDLDAKGNFRELA